MSKNGTRRVPRRQACVRCREQKVRCDISESNSDICTRCRQGSYECKIAPPHRRYADRSTKQSSKSSAHASLKPALAAPEQLPITPLSEPSQQDDASLLHPSTASTPIYIRRDHLPTDRPKNRDLHGLYFEGTTVQELFQLYFDKYASFIPILDPTIKPDDYFEKSSILFWSIMTVGSRKSSLCREVTSELTKRTLSLAMSSLNTSALHVIESLLILLTWWLPTISTLIETPTVQVGCLLYLAMHIGLHDPVRSQDFARLKMSLTKNDIAHRSRLWAHTVVLYQKYWTIAGTPCEIFSSIGSDAQAVVGNLPAPLRYQRSLLKAMTASIAPLVQQSQLAESGVSPLSIDSLIKLGDSQLMTLDPGEGNEASFDKLHWLAGRLMVYSHHLHQSLPQPTEVTLNLYEIACSFLRQLRHLQHTTPNFISSGTTFVLQSSLTAMFTLIHLIAHPPFATLVNVQDANDLIMNSVTQQTDFGFGKPHEDWTAKMGLMLRQLRASPRAFRDETGQPRLELRIKSRGPMSVVHDVVWWVRQECAGIPDAYKGKMPGYMEAINRSNGQQEPGALRGINLQSFSTSNMPNTSGAPVLNESGSATSQFGPPAVLNTTHESLQGWQAPTDLPQVEDAASTFGPVHELNDMVPDIDWGFFDDLFFGTS